MRVSQGKQISRRAVAMPTAGTSLALESLAKSRRNGLEIHAFDRRAGAPLMAKRATATVLREQWIHEYGDAAGLPRLRKAIASRATSAWGLPIRAEDNVLITIGAREAIFCLMMVCLDPGDEVVVLDPCWPGFAPCVTAAGGRVVTVPLSSHDGVGFGIDVEQIRERLTSSTRMLVINTPHNPTGMVVPTQTLERIAALARDRELLVLVDESYEGATFDGAEHKSLAALPDMFTRTVTVSSVSKLAGMPGWRVGWAIGDSQIIERMLAFHRATVGCSPQVTQTAAVAVIEGGVGVVRRRRQELQRRRDWALSVLLQIPRLRCGVPQGGFFLFPSIESFGVRSSVFAERLLEEGAIHVLPGSVFGSAGEGHVRIGFNTSWRDLRTGMMAFATVLRGWS
jgi:aspartate/methionine/tyrosine aminotransferase